MPDRFIVTPFNGEKFITTKKVGDKTLIINTSIENAKDVNRIGVVVSLPLNYEGNIQIGDQVVIQHNIFRTYFDGQGKTRESDSYIKDKLFQVLPEQIFLIFRGEETISVDNFVFIEPIIEEKKWIGTTELEHVGIVKYSNRILEAQGVFVGDKIAFKSDSEYSFDIKGIKLYRIRTRNILAILY